MLRFKKRPARKLDSTSLQTCHQIGLGIINASEFQ